MRRNFNRVLNELNEVRRQLSEDYIFNGEDGPMDDNMEMEEDPRRMMGNMPQQGTSEEETAMHAQEVIQHEPIIGKIRETAIEGLKKYADHPTSSLYEFFKKVFLESDKVLTDTGNKK